VHVAGWLSVEDYLFARRIRQQLAGRALVFIGEAYTMALTWDVMLTFDPGLVAAWTVGCLGIWRITSRSEAMHEAGGCPRVSKSTYPRMYLVGVSKVALVGSLRSPERVHGSRKGP
jgi:hypothetical protein